MLLCAVCNGIRMLDLVCPACSYAAEDYGRASDWNGPYAPYEPIEFEDMFAATQLEDVPVCRHSAYCSHCSHTFVVEVVME
ncbi:hypothetical protein DFQ01_13518 [Paenibacillus cellulosilyticus]|uniref:Uncharacterized protein n=1 Tax=Paenibacillus cellulosilyticus TaxID=375489 RepID=A0A2V2YGY4_9BACL|nr:hypothetical protein [Paenibacillus cellulosilyticus]PWV92457.1 hypothetical protein DFQ01_13518 [Paenibacillus cellulosilyticus]QKS47032.1 hypothetical protein HUB94_21450 [Paenibacillus cellulosilyticus]